MTWRLKMKAFSVFVAMIVVFAALYRFALKPDDFSWTPVERASSPSPIDYLYFSCTTMTTIGYGDIYPKSTRARALVMLQQLVAISILSFLLFRSFHPKTKK